ncbi:MAG: hypothetical protein GF344_00350 [Chitinivibrionales bacterium]|nr:hypothetical protein [Chitinivibrionales bacterium]MBD3355577.1 hypothetical protein [Chitinivibrionales bacterium]
MGKFFLRRFFGLRIPSLVVTLSIPLSAAQDGGGLGLASYDSDSGNAPRGAIVQMWELDSGYFHGMGGPYYNEENGQWEYCRLASTDIRCMGNDGRIRRHVLLDDSGAGERAMIMSDVDGDGVVEIIVADRKKLVILRGSDGSISAEAEMHHFFSAHGGRLLLAGGKMKSDGSIGILVYGSTEDGTGLVCFQANGEVAWKWSTAGSRKTGSVVCADIDFDGLDEIFVYGSGLWCIEADGRTRWESDGVAGHIRFNDILIDDFDNDDAWEVATLLKDGTMGLLVASSGAVKVVCEAPHEVYDMCGGRLAPAKPADLLALRNDGKAGSKVWFRSHVGSSRQEPVISLKEGAHSSELICSDVNGDGVDEIVIAENGIGGAGIWVYSGTGETLLHIPGERIPGNDGSQRITFPTSGADFAFDINGNGRAEVHAQCANVAFLFEIPTEATPSKSPRDAAPFVRWRFEENWRDEAGRGELKAHRGAFCRTAAEGATAASFETGSAVAATELSGLPDALSDSFSVLLWIRKNMDTDLGVALRLGGGEENCLTVRTKAIMPSLTKVPIVEIRSGGDESSLCLLKSGSADDAYGEWRFVAITFSSADRKCRLYIDGNLRDSCSWTGWGRRNGARPDESVYIGGWREGTGLNHTFVHGLIDDVSIYNRAMSRAEVRALYKRRKGE